MAQYARLLMIVVYISTSIGACTSSKELPNTNKNTAQTALINTYRNAAYDISLNYPQQWKLIEESNLEVGEFAINLIKRDTDAKQGIPLEVHTEPGHSYLSIWPHGLGTELPYSQYTTFEKYPDAPDISFKVDSSASKVLILDDGSAWAYFVVPAHPPEKWSPHGFIFAQIGVTDLHKSCLEGKSGEKISAEECRPLEGDRIVRQGNPIVRDVQIVHSILESLSLKRLQK